MKIGSEFRQLNTTQPPKPVSGTVGSRVQTPKSNPNFTGALDMVLRFLDTNQAWGACAVDLSCMVIPRTLTDFTRGADAGLETMRREGMGTTNDTLVGVYAAAAGSLLGAGINSAYKINSKQGDIKVNNVYADAETLDMHGASWNKVLKENKSTPIHDHIVNVLKQYEFFRPTENGNGEWVKFENEETINKAASILEKEIQSNTSKMSKEAASDVKNILISGTGAESNWRIISKDEKNPHSARYSVDYITENIYKLGKIFNKDTIKETFEKSADVTANKFLKSMKSLNATRSLMGVGFASLIGMSVQPFNMYLTRKKTGKSGFVGGGGEDKSTGFKIKKTLLAALFGGFVLWTIGNPKNILKDLQFKGFTPTIKQFKFIYGLTIMSRLISARNSNELTESFIKDFLGFVNWLILGNFVQKLVAQSMDKTLIKKEGKGIINWIKNSSLKSRDEVLHASLGEKAFKDGHALKFNEMLKVADKSAKKQLRILSVAQLAGYLYSGLVLGLGIPKLNIYLTKRREAKKAEQNQSPTEQSGDIMFKSANRDYLYNKYFTVNKTM